MNNICAGLVGNGEGCILLVLRKKPIRADYANMYELPGGAIEPGETIAHAVSREILEETGYDTYPIANMSHSYFSTMRAYGVLYRIRIDALLMKIGKGKIAEPVDDDIRTHAWIDIESIFSEGLKLVTPQTYEFVCDLALGDYSDLSPLYPHIYDKELS